MMIERLEGRITPKEGFSCWFPVLRAQVMTTVQSVAAETQSEAMGPAEEYQIRGGKEDHWGEMAFPLRSWHPDAPPLLLWTEMHAAPDRSPRNGNGGKPLIYGRHLSARRCEVAFHGFILDPPLRASSCLCGPLWMQCSCLLLTKPSFTSACSCMRVQARAWFICC